MARYRQGVVISLLVASTRGRATFPDIYSNERPARSINKSWSSTPCQISRTASNGERIARAAPARVNRFPMARD
jgi:hypothetical protein